MLSSYVLPTIPYSSSVILPFRISLTAIAAVSRQEKILTYCVVNKFEMPKLKEVVHSLDPKAFIVTEDVHEVEGVRVRKHH